MSLEEPTPHHRRTSFDHLLEAPIQDGSDDSEANDDTEPLLNTPPQPRLAHTPTPGQQRRAQLLRYLALLFACLLSVGSHYASYTLAPLKSRISRELGTSHTEFSLIISAFSLNSTWTPLIGGLLASRLGTTITSIIATGLILAGQVLLLFGDVIADIRLMVLGMFVFGMGVSPLAVVQETIIVRFFKSHGLGKSMAFGLLAGKGASFVSARTSYILTERYGTQAPFIVSTLLAAASVVVNILYIIAANWLVDGAGAELESNEISAEARRRSVINMSEAAALEKIASKRKVHFGEIAKLGDLFWAYIVLNILTGTVGSPFTHLAANIIEQRYGLGEKDAARIASYALAGCFVMYPLGGYLVDRYKHRPIVVQLLFMASLSTLASYAWLAAPPAWTGTPEPAILLYAIGHGIIPLLLVVIVPQLVHLKYVSTALGVHKSLEQTGSTIFQTLAGISLDLGKKTHLLAFLQISRGLQILLNAFLVLNGLQLGSIVLLAVLQQGARARQHLPPDDVTATTPLSSSIHSHRRYSPVSRRSRIDEQETRKEVIRGKIFLRLSIALVLFAWVLFMGTAWYKLGSKQRKPS